MLIPYWMVGCLGLRITLDDKIAIYLVQPRKGLGASVQIKSPTVGIPVTLQKKLAARLGFTDWFTDFDLINFEQVPVNGKLVRITEAPFIFQSIPKEQSRRLGLPVRYLTSEVNTLYYPEESGVRYLNAGEVEETAHGTDRKRVYDSNGHIRNITIPVIEKE